MEPKIYKESQGIRLLRGLFLEGNRIFNMNDVARVAELEKIPKEQINKILSNLVKHNLIIRLHRGLYVSIGLLPAYTSLHSFIISAYLIQPSAISHWSALHYHGLTDEIPQIVSASTIKKIVTPSMRAGKSHHKTKHMWLIDNVRYEYVTVQEKHFFGVESIWFDEYYQVNITDKERTMIDMFAYPKMFGGIGAALGVLESAILILDIPKLIAYAIRYDKKSLIKRLGWALESFGVEESILEPLLISPIKHYCRLDPSSPPVGACNKRWMIQNNLVRVNQ